MAQFLINEDVISQIRQRVQFYIFDQDYESAVFWLEKIYLFSKSNCDLYHYVQTLLMGRQYRLAMSAILNKYTDKINDYDNELLYAPLWARYLLAKCYSNLGMTSEALGLLRDVPNIMTSDRLVKNLHMSVTESFVNINQTSILTSMNDENFIDKYMLSSACSKLKGTLFEFQSRNEAAGSFSRALVNDFFAYSAARKLFEDKMLMPSEIQKLSQITITEITKITQSHMTSFFIAIKLAFFMYHISSGSLTFRYSRNWLQLLLFNPESTKNPDEAITEQREYIESLFGASIDLKRWKIREAMTISKDNKALEMSRGLVNYTRSDMASVLIHALLLFKVRQYEDLNILNDRLSKDANLTLTNQINYRIISALKDVSLGYPLRALESLRICVKLSSTGAIRLASWLLSPSFLWVLLGHCSWQSGDKEYALASYTSAADASPGDYLTWQYIGALHAELKEFSLALNYYIKGYKILRRELKYDPLILTNELAVILVIKGKYDTAIKLFMRVFPETEYTKLTEKLTRSKFCKAYSVALYNLSYCLLMSEQVDKAFKYCQIGLIITKGSVNLYKLAGVLYDLKGEHTNARFKYQEALMEASKINEAKFAPKYCQRVMELPPKITSYSSFKQVEHFCNFMIKKSIELEKASGKRYINQSNRNITAPQYDTILP